MVTLFLGLPLSERVEGKTHSSLMSLMMMAYMSKEGMRLYCLALGTLVITAINVGVKVA